MCITVITLFVSLL